MGIRFLCPNGHKLNVKAYLAGERGICPQCDAKFLVPSESGGQVEPIVENSTTDPAPASPAPTPQPAPQTTPQPSQQPTPQSVAEVTSPAAPPPPPSPSEPTPATPPPTESLEEVWYVRTADGQQYGPATKDLMQSWVAEGRVTVDCWVWRSGWSDWKPGGQAITLLNVVPGSAPATQQPTAEAAAVVPDSDAPTADSLGAGAAPDSLPQPSNPTTMYQTHRRLRQERARKITLLLGVLVMVLFAVLIVVLINNK